MSINNNNNNSDNNNNSFFSFPPPLEENFSQAFHQTLCVPSSSQTPPQFPPNNPSSILNSFNPFNVRNPFNDFPVNDVRNSAGKSRFSRPIDLMSCTESLGFESSHEIITSFDDLGFFNYNRNNNLGRRFSSINNNKEASSSSSSSSASCFNYCSSSRISRRREKMVSKTDFPPPLTTLEENGRRNFTLKSVRENGRLKINEEVIERPEILRATRENGRLRLHLIQDAVVTSSDDEDDDVNDGDLQEEEEETGEFDILKMPTLRRCYDQHQYVWGPHQYRCVTTI